MNSELLENDEILNEIDKFKYNIYVSEYATSISDLINYYEDGDINLSPNYQRVYKWDEKQKSKFIESLFLGLPMPPIFLYQDEYGKWEVIDGVQRLSSIFQFVGILVENEDPITYQPALILSDLPKLTKLEDKTFDNLSTVVKREFKKSRLNLIIIQKRSDDETKYEIFRRINGYGTVLTSQEIRNAIIIMINSELFNEIDKISNYSSYKEAMHFSSKKLNNKDHFQYFIRFLAMRERDCLRSAENRIDIEEFLDEIIIKIAKGETNLNLSKEIQLFKDTFDFINSFDEPILKNYNVKKGKFEAQVFTYNFELIIPGMSEHLDSIKNKFSKSEIVEFIKQLYKDDQGLKKIKDPNPKVIPRFKQITDLSFKKFEEFIND